MNGWASLRGSLSITFTGRIFGFVSLVVLGVAGYLLLHEQQVLEKELQNRGLLTATHLAEQSLDPILREDDYALFKLVQVLRNTHGRDLPGEEKISYAMVLDPRGQALAHTDPGQVYATLTDARTREILAQPEASVVSVTGPAGERLYDVAVPIRMRGLPVGAVRLGLSRAGVEHTLRDLALKVIAVLFLLMLVGIGSIWRFSRRMVHPIHRLRDSARAVQAGDLSQRVAVDRADEIGQLALAFNAMTTELARSHDELERKEQMRARLLEQVITAQEDERKRIARELHDETSQALTSLMVGLKLLEQRPELAEMRESLADLRALTGKTLDAVHDLALQLRPSVLDDLGLVPAVDRIVEEFRRTHGIRVTFETNLRAGPRLPASLETALYRITQEALTNVARHAGAQSVSLLLEARRGSVRLIVEDDGRGFDVASCMSESRGERCLGVFGMRERATLLGGTLTIESTPGSGTTIFVEVPLPLPLTGYPLGASPPSEGERNG
ncbi:MAG: HAMP domain-containing protein [candidate division NC10 bacterium]|nr:HAMP domain-containing protein [candidate division NC10 bacterium]MBI2114764.1 HAMP domain-containing protein [candidate division NC10 bacterium]MBI3084574.1 HAMP domain-containing protein [candidate division NC10 bacterium]